MTTTDTSAFVDERVASALVNVPVRTLQRWRYVGEGPPWMKLGRKMVRYNREALLEWAESQTRQAN